MTAPKETEHTHSGIEFLPITSVGIDDIPGTYPPDNPHMTFVSESYREGVRHMADACVSWAIWKADSVAAAVSPHSPPHYSTHEVINALSNRIVEHSPSAGVNKYPSLVKVTGHRATAVTLELGSSQIADIRTTPDSTLDDMLQVLIPAPRPPEGRILTLEPAIVIITPFTLSDSSKSESGVLQYAACLEVVAGHGHYHIHHRYKWQKTVSPYDKRLGEWEKSASYAGWRSNLTDSPTHPFRGGKADGNSR